MSYTTQLQDLQNAAARMRACCAAAAAAAVPPPTSASEAANGGAPTATPTSTPPPSAAADEQDWERRLAAVNAVVGASPSGAAAAAAAAALHEQAAAIGRSGSGSSSGSAMPTFQAELAEAVAECPGNCVTFLPLGECCCCVLRCFASCPASRLPPLPTPSLPLPHQLPPSSSIPLCRPGPALSARWAAAALGGRQHLPLLLARRRRRPAAAHPAGRGPALAGAGPRAAAARLAGPAHRGLLRRRLPLLFPAAVPEQVGGSVGVGVCVCVWMG